MSTKQQDQMCIQYFLKWELGWSVLNVREAVTSKQVTVLAKMEKQESGLPSHLNPVQ